MFLSLFFCFFIVRLGKHLRTQSEGQIKKKEEESTYCNNYIFFLTSKLCNRLISCAVFAGTVNVWFSFLTSRWHRWQKMWMNLKKEREKKENANGLDFPFHYFHNSSHLHWQMVGETVTRQPCFRTVFFFNEHMFHHIQIKVQHWVVVWKVGNISKRGHICFQEMKNIHSCICSVFPDCYNKPRVRNKRSRQHVNPWLKLENITWKPVKSRLEREKTSTHISSSRDDTCCCEFVLKWWTAYGWNWLCGE